MGWVRLDDVFPEHPKVLGLSDAAFRVHVHGLCYSNRYLTDGFVPDAVRPGAKAVRDLIAAGLWNAIEGGWLIHDYLEYNEPRAAVLAERQAAKERRSGQRPPNVGGTNGKPSVAPSHPILTKEPLARNPLHDALAEAEGSNPAELTKTRARTIGVALAEIQKASPDVTPDEIARRARAYPQVMPPGTKLTAPALASHWARCGSGSGREYRPYDHVDWDQVPRP